MWSSCEVGITTEKLKRYKSPGGAHIPVEPLKIVRKTLHSETHKCVNPIWNMEECQTMEGIYYFVYSSEG
jgi:hypothetical protein